MISICQSQCETQVSHCGSSVLGRPTLPQNIIRPPRPRTHYKLFLTAAHDHRGVEVEEEGEAQLQMTVEGRIMLDLCPPPPRSTLHDVDAEFPLGVGRFASAARKAAGGLAGNLWNRLQDPCSGGCRSSRPQEEPVHLHIALWWLLTLKRN